MQYLLNWRYNRSYHAKILYYPIIGSLPERDGDKLYNTCPVFNPSGDLVAKYRKMHLFDVDIPGKIRFQESETLSPGNSLTIVDTG